MIYLCYTKTIEEYKKQPPNKASCFSYGCCNTTGSWQQRAMAGGSWVVEIKVQAVFSNRLVILEKNLFDGPLNEIHNIKICETIMDGKTTYSNY